MSEIDESDEGFREELRGFIADNLPPEIAARTLMGYHPHKPDVVYWTQKLNERGWSVPHWPVEYGGPGWSVTRQHIFFEETFLAGCPALAPQGVFLVGPTIIMFGNQAQKDFFLPKIRSGEHFWGQGFSEPNAGSDLASLQTRAVADGDNYLVNGQKIWTSEAHYSEWVFLLVRTSTEGRKQAGISFLLADLSTPGVTIRPIEGIDGGHILNEVFLEDVRVPVENLVGEEGEGWSYAKELLARERTFSAEVPRCKGMLLRVRKIAEAAPMRGGKLIDNPHFSGRLAELEVEFLAHEATLWRAVAEEEANASSAALTSSTLKVRGTELIQRVGALMVEALGDDALPVRLEKDYLFNPPADGLDLTDAPGATADYFYRRSMTIYGGSNEVQRNIIAAQILRG